MEIFYVNFLNKEKNFKEDIREFKGVNARKNAIDWCKENFEKFDLDMIKSREVKKTRIKL
ncbi:hypothetical protein [Aquimarina sp. 2304DJ70-9]|uniref:hypothetical protein n=1 Tax=Aquimarina penaris TaxID=3231044 RepID=UPI0034618C99